MRHESALCRIHALFMTAGARLHRRALGRSSFAKRGALRSRNKDGGSCAGAAAL